MEDKLLIDGLFARDERSVARLEEKYSGYCYTVAYAVVRCREDAQECVGDAMLGAWILFRRTGRRISEHMSAG